MPIMKDSQTANSGIETSADGTTYIPSSKRADGSTRKEIRVRPGYRPPEDVATYKNRSAEAWKNRGTGGVPGMETPVPGSGVTENKSKNAKRREAARKKAQDTATPDSKVISAAEKHAIAAHDDIKESWRNTENLASNPTAGQMEEIELQKRIRNQLKKLKAVQELKAKKAAGEKLSHDQLVKIGKETELLRDLRKLKYEGPEVSEGMQSKEELTNGSLRSGEVG